MRHSSRAATASGGDVPITCHEECYQLYCGGLHLGAGKGPGPNSNVCSAGGCSGGGCEAEEDQQAAQADLEEVLSLVVNAAAAAADLSTLVALYGDKLVANPDRNLLVVLGGRTLGPVAVVTVTDEQAVQLAQLAVEDLDDYLVARSQSIVQDQ